MASDDLIEMIERKLKEYGLKKVIPGDDLLGEAYQAFHHSQQLREIFEKAESEYENEENDTEVPKDLKERVCAILDKHNDLRWDDAIKIVLDESLDDGRENKQEAREKSGDFANNDDGDDC